MPWGIIIGGEELHNNHHLEPNLYTSDIEYKVDQAFYNKCNRIIKQHFFNHE